MYNTDMLKDITLKITSDMVKTAQGNEAKAFTGHLGTHFDVMNKEFPLEYAIRNGYIYDVHAIANKEITSEDIDLSKIEEGMFVGFYTGWIERYAYGTKEYFHGHPQISMELLEALLARNTAMIGIDAPGLRRGSEHVPIDQKCADHGAFVVENLYDLKEVTERKIRVYTFPMRYEGMSGLPCRVLCEE